MNRHHPLSNPLALPSNRFRMGLEAGLLRRHVTFFADAPKHNPLIGGALVRSDSRRVKMFLEIEYKSMSLDAVSSVINNSNQKVRLL
jgi:hypothetical protein